MWSPSSIFGVRQRGRSDDPVRDGGTKKIPQSNASRHNTGKELAAARK
jgi:hypothetical protein